MGTITLQNITKSFHNQPVVRDLDLSVGCGEMVALLGPSGCGKTTTLKLIAGLLFPDSGEIFLDGVAVTSRPAEKRDVVMVFQEHLLFPHLTVEENIGFGLKMQGVDRATIQRRVAELLEMVQMAGFGRHYPAQLSGGQRQRVALARALALKPRVLLLDEPLASLDSRLRGEMRDLVLRLHRSFRMTTLLVTHDQEEAMYLADRIALMLDGRIVQCDTPVKMYTCPQNREVAAFFGECAFVGGTVRDGVFFAPWGEFTVDSDLTGEAIACLRPEHIRVEDPVINPELPRARVIDRRYGGGKMYYKLHLAGMSFVAVTAGAEDILPGAEAAVAIDWRRVWLLPG